MILELSAGVETRPIADTLADAIERTGYRKMLEEEGTEDARSRLANLDELLNAAADASERGEGLRDFLDHAALVSDADSADERAPVSLLTMHNAKGLEFPVVFIAGLEEGLFPHSRSLDSESAMEEERRLCYVGMTRAETKLYLSWARYRRRFGGGLPEVSLPSRFLKEVPANLIERVRGDRGHVDLYAERHQVRETASGTSILGRLTTQSRTSGSFSRKRVCRCRRASRIRFRLPRVSQWRRRSRLVRRRSGRVQRSSMPSMGAARCFAWRARARTPS